MTETTPDLPPRPQYGEYATPEEQRARIRQPNATADLDAGIGASQPVGQQVSRPVTTATPAQPVPASGVPRSRAIDRIVTFALLAYGLITVLSSVPALLDYGSYADTVLNLLGVNAQLSDPAAGRPWGIAAAIVLGVGWVLTAAVSWRSIRRGRLTWWIPIAGGLVFTLASSVLVLVPLMSDPAVWAAIQGTIG